MIDFIIPAVLSLGGIGILITTVLYFVFRKFEVTEDQKIVKIQSVLPTVNCGGCGFPGCAGFADACAKAQSLDGLFCPVGGTVVMNYIASILGKSAIASEPHIAVVHCQGDYNKRPRINRYDGVNNCALASSLYSGETACSFGCLGFGDCTEACLFGALSINSTTRLPEVDEDKCTACGACVKVCPKKLIQLRKKGTDSHQIYVGCMNKDKGAEARKACTVACIGCSKCVRTCALKAISITSNLAYIDDAKCTLCGKCIDECPTGAIVEYLKIQTLC